MAIQIHARELLATTEAELKAEGFHYEDHQNDGLLYTKTVDGYLYKAVMNLDGRIFRYKPEKIQLRINTASRN